MSGLANFRNLSRLLTALALGLLVWLLYTADLWEMVRDLDSSALVLVAAGSLGLTGAWFSLAAAWSVLVHRLAEAPQLSRRRHGGIYARTQIQKYLPGNVFHFLLRHLEARRQGEADEPLFWACVGELLGQVISAGIVAALALSLFLTPAHGLMLFGALLAVILLIVVGLRLLEKVLPLALRVLVRVVGKRGQQWYEGIDLKKVRLSSRDIAVILPLQGIYVVVMGLVAWGLSFAVEPFSVELIFYVTGVTALAWIVGFILPGAPGGLGPREAILASALAGVSSVETALFVALALRVCSILSDLLFYGVGVLAGLVKEG